MGGAVTVLRMHLNKYETKLYMPNRTLDIFPEKRKFPPRSVAVVYKALPSGVKYPEEQENQYWWVDVSFLPYSETQLVTSVGAYIHRQGMLPLTVCSRRHGIIHLFTVSDDKLAITVIKGTSTSSEPNIHMHPDAKRMCYAGCGATVVTNLHTLQSVIKEKDMRMNNFRTAVASPNGMFLATIAKCSTDVELTTFAMDGNFLLKQDMIRCHTICRGFTVPRNSYQRCECHFSQDSDHIAVGGSMGYLFIVKRYELKNYCSIIPGLFDPSKVKLSNERCFDFDRRFLSTYLAFCDEKAILRVLDIHTGTTVLTNSVNIGSEHSEVQCLCYSPHGRFLALGTSHASIHMYDPDTLSLLYILNAADQSAGNHMVRQPTGKYPSILRTSFSTTEELMAVSSTDGLVRIWQLDPNLSLQALCRRAILQTVKVKDIPDLPLPAKVALTLLQWPTE